MPNPLRAVRDWLDARRLRAELRSLNGGGGAVPAAPVLSGTFVTPESVLGLTAVYAAINAIASDVACLPRHVYRTLDGGGLAVEQDHPAEWLLDHEPNDEMGEYRYLQTTMGHVLGRGNGYAEIVREGGRPAELAPLHPVRTVPRRTDKGRLYYELENKRTLLPEDVLHLAGLGFDGIRGYCAVTLCRQSLGVVLATEQFGAAFFGNGAIPAGVLKHPRRLSEAAQANLRKTINQVHQGSQAAHNLLILEEGMDWADRQISPEDSQFIEGRKFGVLEVARLFRIPPHKLGDYSQAHVANVEESNLDYLATTILSWVCMIDDEATRKLLTREERRAGLVVLTDLRALHRGNTAVRTTYYQAMRNLGVMSADDIRKAEGMNPLPPGSGGDLYLVQAQYRPLDRAADPMPAPAPKTAARNRRFNPNHGEDGKFGSGAGGGSPSAAGDFADHREVKELKKDHAAQLRELEADQAAERKGLAKDQAREVKELDRDHERQRREQERDQRRESKDLAKEQDAELKETDEDDLADVKDTHRIDRENLAESHAGDREALARDQAQEKQDQAADHEYQRKQLAESHEEDLAGLRRDQADDLAEVVSRLKDEAEEESDR